MVSYLRNYNNLFFFFFVGDNFDRQNFDIPALGEQAATLINSKDRIIALRRVTNDALTSLSRDVVSNALSRLLAFSR